MESTKQLKLGAVLSYASIVVNIIIGIVYTPWMISSIGRADFGLYTLAMSVISLFVFDFGLSAAVTRFIAKYIAEGNQKKTNDCLGLVYRMYFTMDIVLLLILTILFFFIPTIYTELTLEEIEKFKIIYVFAAFYSVLSFPFIPVNGILTAHEKFVQFRICDIVQKVVIVIAMTACLLLGYGLYALVLVNAVAGLLAIMLKLFFIKKDTTQSISWNYFNKVEFREILGYSGWVTVIALAQRCIFNVAPSILGALSGSTAIAILGIAITLEGYTFTFASALNGMFLPRVSKIVAQGDGNVLPFMIKVGRLQIYIISLIVFGVICFGKEFIHLWVGDDFSESYLCAVFIIVPSLLHLPQDIGTQTVYAKNEVKCLSVIYTGMAIVNLVLATLLAPKFGALGICISVFVAYLIRTIGMDILFYKRLQIDILAFFKQTYIRMLPVLGLILFLGILMNKFLPLQGIVGFTLKVVLFAFVYILLIVTCAMNKDEKALFITPITKIMKKLFILVVSILAINTAC